MVAMKPIETIYNGYRFRSRLEARWAVFFDTLGVEYRYELEGFELGNGRRYLPDFWLPKQKCWIEIKGKKPTEEEEKKSALFASRLDPDIRIYTLAGEIPFPDADYSVSRDLSYKAEHMWVECPFCGNLDISKNGLWMGLSCCEMAMKDSFLWSLIAMLCETATIETAPPNWKRKVQLFLACYNSPRLMAAYTAARQARFEHGERP